MILSQVKTLWAECLLREGGRLQLPLSNDKTSAWQEANKGIIPEKRNGRRKAETGPVALGRHPPISLFLLFLGMKELQLSSSRRFLRGASPDKPGQS
ncbi:MAG: hypothetical protein ACLT8E_06475 [Akkermansia sp.]